MANIAFIWRVESQAMDMMVPLLLQGLCNKFTVTKCYSAVIVDSISMPRLVDESLRVFPFLTQLLLTLEVDAWSILDPEAQGMVGNVESNRDMLGFY